MSLEPLTIHLGRQTRELVYTMRSQQILRKQLDDKNPQTLMLYHRTPALVVLVAAAMMGKEDLSGRKKEITALRVGEWIDKEPKKYRELEIVTMRALTRGLAALGEIKVTKELVEAGDATADMIKEEDIDEEPSGNDEGGEAP